MSQNKAIAVVIIGRNEGERLVRCIQSMLEKVGAIVYVDSGSSDDSVEYCRSQGLDVVELDMSLPFTAARARNEGFSYIKRMELPEFIQFIDGDCALGTDWLEKAESFLVSNEGVGLVCGVRKEIFPERSWYNFLCDLEWNGPKGDIQESGGDFLVRSSVFEAINGFDGEVIAGEEPELCYRIRMSGWKIHRLDEMMTSHDANITTVKQWWGRSVRSGHAYANIAYMHRDSKEKIYQKETKSIVFWGAVVPVSLVAGLLFYYPVACFIIACYLYISVKVYSYGKKSLKLNNQQARYYALSIVAGKLPHAYGVLKYICRVISRRQMSIIEYK